MTETWSSPDFDLLPKLKALKIHTLVIYGDHDFILAATAEHITRAIPTARMHGYAERLRAFFSSRMLATVREQIDSFSRGNEVSLSRDCCRIRTDRVSEEEDPDEDS